MENKELKQKIVTLLKPHGVRSIAIFGSYARGEETSASDLDILVEFSAKKTLFDIVGIEQELSETFGISVDLLTERAISPYLVDRIKKELVFIYG
ncbi:DNA polymerase beta domain-containing protein [Candidatus Magnetobacterium bavaricum]|uniref:DNA polymerase beta domain-containing protein n=1 Tax=Candidatus Magnetobacterium bavaricum TaxID=29290 RepID=A0A0F3GL04_9BACT|nr:DNA polymerase beta domain-containing protein [Candidatus Magnetobacterium bavaricum]